MKLTQADLTRFQNQFEHMQEVLGGLEGKTVLGFACVVITAEDGAGMLFGGDTQLITTGIDLISSTHHANTTGPDAIQEIIEEMLATEH